MFLFFLPSELTAFFISDPLNFGSPSSIEFDCILFPWCILQLYGGGGYMIYNFNGQTYVNSFVQTNMRLGLAVLVEDGSHLKISLNNNLIKQQFFSSFTFSTLAITSWPVHALATNYDGSVFIVATSTSGQISIEVYQKIAGSYTLVYTDATCNPTIMERSLSFSNQLGVIAYACSSNMKIIKKSGATYVVTSSFSTGFVYRTQFQRRGNKLLVVESLRGRIVTVDPNGAVLANQIYPSPFLTGTIGDNLMALSDASTLYIFDFNFNLIHSQGGNFAQVQIVGNRLFYLMNRIVLIYQFCSAGTFVYLGSCVNQCPIGYKPNGVLCDRCIFDHERDSCVASCSLHQYQDISMVCRSCLPICVSCTDGHSCLTCLANYEQAGRCVQKCLVLGNFKNLTSRRCLPCTGLVFLSQQECLSACPDGTFQLGNLCLTCVKPCLTCAGMTSCLKCQSSTFLYQGACEEACPPGLFSTETTCEACSHNCSSCKSSANSCTSCNGDFNLHQKQCVLQCPDKYFAHQNVCRLQETDLVRLVFRVSGLQKAFGEKQLSLQSNQDLTPQDLANFVDIQSDDPFETKFFSPRKISFTWKCSDTSSHKKVFYSTTADSTSRTQELIRFHKSSLEIQESFQFSCLKSFFPTVDSLFDEAASVDRAMYQQPYQTRFLANYLLPAGFTSMFSFYQYQSTTTSPYSSSVVSFFSIGSFQSQRCWSNSCPSSKSVINFGRVLQEQPHIGKALRLINVVLAATAEAILVVLYFISKKIAVPCQAVSAAWQTAERIHEISFLLVLSDISSAQRLNDPQFYVGLIFGLYLMSFLLLRFSRRLEFLHSRFNSSVSRKLFPEFYSSVFRYKFLPLRESSFLAMVIQRPELFQTQSFVLKCFAVMSTGVFLNQPIVQAVIVFAIMLTNILLLQKKDPFQSKIFKNFFFLWTASTYAALILILLSDFFATLENQQASASVNLSLGLTCLCLILTSTVSEFLIGAFQLSYFANSDYEESIKKRACGWIAERISDEKLTDHFLDQLIVEYELNNASLKDAVDINFRAVEITIEGELAKVVQVKSIRFNSQSKFFQRQMNFKAEETVKFNLSSQTVKKVVSKYSEDVKKIVLFCKVSQNQHSFGELIAIQEFEECVIMGANQSRYLKYVPEAFLRVLLSVDFLK